MAENVRGYVILRSIDHHIDPKPLHALTSNRYALLALQSEQLLSGLYNIPPQFSVTLRHTGYHLQDAAVIVVTITAKMISTVDEWLFPKFVQSQSLLDKRPSQPFILQTSWQLSWSDINLNLIMVILLVSCLYAVAGKEICKQLF